MRRADACRFVAPRSHICFRKTTLPGWQVGVGVDPSLDDPQLILARLSACQEIGVTRRLSILTATPGERIGVHCVDEAIYWKSVIVFRRILAPIPNLNRVDRRALWPTPLTL